jgi:hypothetical protein
MELREMLDHLKRDRQFHQTRVEDIDQAFEEIRRELDESITEMQSGGSQQSGDQGESGNQGQSQGSRSQGSQDDDQGQQGNRGRGSNRGRSRRGESGTAILSQILQQNNGSMNRKELLDQAKQQGVSSPYSSLYSMEQRGAIERDRDDNVTLTEQDSGNQGGGGGNQGSRNSGGNR